eukprot:m.32632 g.32632  ORF g.32632 m.32632 type:complete len:88 (+) comp9536_c0_seq1:190-453(+)
MKYGNILINPSINHLADVRGSGLFGNTAKIFVTLNVDVALLSPVGVPGVADNPVWNVVRLIPANKLDAMVKLLSAEVLDDTAGVKLP